MLVQIPVIMERVCKTVLLDTVCKIARFCTWKSAVVSNELSTIFHSGKYLYCSPIKRTGGVREMKTEWKWKEELWRINIKLQVGFFLSWVLIWKWQICSSCCLTSVFQRDVLCATLRGDFWPIEMYLLLLVLVKGSALDSVSSSRQDFNKPNLQASFFLSAEKSCSLNVSRGLAFAN